MTSESAADGSTPGPFPSDLIILAEMGRVTDEEAEIVLQHSRALRFLSRCWDEHPPSTAMLADLLTRDASGALEILRRAHLDHDGLRAFQTARRLRELEQLKEEVPDTVAWMSLVESCAFTTFGGDARRQTDVTEVDIRAGATPAIDILIKNGLLSTDAERLTVRKTSPEPKPFAWVALVYKVREQQEGGLSRELREVTDPIIYSGSALEQTVQLKHHLEPNALFRIFISSSLKIPISHPSNSRSEPRLPKNRRFDHARRARESGGSSVAPRPSGYTPPSRDRSRD